jgi:hypothetical protein
MNSPQADEHMRSRGLEGELTVGANVAFYRGPILDLTNEAPTAAAAIKGIAVARDEVEAQLNQLQSDQKTNPDYFIRPVVVVSPDRASAVFSSTLRRVVAAVALGVFWILVAAMVAEAFSTSRANRRDLRASRRPGSEHVADAPDAISDPVTHDDAPVPSLTGDKREAFVVAANGDAIERRVGARDLVADVAVRTD